jgi:hypothetical protein
MQPDHRLEILPITNINDTFHYHALIYYQEGTYKICAITPLIVNSVELSVNKKLFQLLQGSIKSLSQIIN